MAELPEIRKIAEQMHKELFNRVITDIEIIQPKCANVDADVFARRIKNSKIVDVDYLGKWIVISLSNQENVYISLGMGGDILYFSNEEVKSKQYQISLNLDQGVGFTIKYWWFGKFLLFHKNEKDVSNPIRKISLDPFKDPFTVDHFQTLLLNKKMSIKAFLLDQSNISGIGNMYIHDILFKSGIHPLSKIAQLDEHQVKKLYQSILDVLQFSFKKGSFSHEKDFYGKYGGYSSNDFLIAYKEGEKCPSCSNIIEKIKTGSTSSYICFSCQKL